MKTTKQCCIQLLAGIAALLAVACHAATLGLAPRPQVSGGAVRVAGGQTISLQARVQLDAPAGLGTKALPPGWDSASITLRNTALLKAPQATGSPIPRSSFTNNSTTTPPLQFSSLRPGSGYQLEVRLSRSGNVVGSGVSATFALSPSVSPQLITVPIRFTYGRVATVAGSSAGFLDQPGGPATSAQFSGPVGAVDDGSGIIYVADTGNNRIRRVDTGTGAVTTVAGTGSNAEADSGLGTAATLSQPQSPIISGGKVIFVDAGGNTVRAMNLTAPYAVSTLAGSAAVSGTADGTGTAALFTTPAAITADSSGNLYVADGGNHTVRKLQPSNGSYMVTTLAGAPRDPGYADGTGTLAHFYTPAGIAYNPVDGMLYVADNVNNRIRRVDPGSGAVTTFAGSGSLWQPGNPLDGAGTAVNIPAPRALAADSDGNLYLQDGTQTIRQITPAAQVSLVAGVAGATAGAYGYSYGYALDSTFFNGNGISVRSDGSLLVTDTGNNLILKLDTLAAAVPIIDSVAPAGAAAGVPVTISGDGFAAFGQANNVSINGTDVAAAGSSRTQVSFTVPVGASSGTLRVTNHGRASTSDPYFQVIAPALTIGALAGSAGNTGSTDGSGGQARFNTPVGVALDGSGSLLVADSFNNVIRRITGTNVVTYAGSGAASEADAASPLSAAFGTPFGLAVDVTGDGSVYVADQGGRTIRRISSAGVVSTLAGSTNNFGSADGTGAGAYFESPSGIVVSGGVVYVSDSGAHTLRRVGPTGIVTTFAGQADVAGLQDGVGSAALFNQPMGLATYTDGTFIVCDQLNHAIRRVSQDGRVVTLAGNGSPGFRDGPANQAQFNNPVAAVVAGNGNIFVADQGNAVLRRIDPAGNVTTVAGNGKSATVNGSASRASIKSPAGMAILGSTIYLTDDQDHVVRKVSSGIVVGI